MACSLMVKCILVCLVLVTHSLINRKKTIHFIKIGLILSKINCKLLNDLAES